MPATPRTIASASSPHSRPVGRPLPLMLPGLETTGEGDNDGVGESDGDGGAGDRLPLGAPNPSGVNGLAVPAAVALTEGSADDVLDLVVVVVVVEEPLTVDSLLLRRDGVGTAVRRDDGGPLGVRRKVGVAAAAGDAGRRAGVGLAVGVSRGAPGGAAVGAAVLGPVDASADGRGALVVGVGVDFVVNTTGSVGPLGPPSTATAVPAPESITANASAATSTGRSAWPRPRTRSTASPRLRRCRSAPSEDRSAPPRTA